ncbi:hypothetical protein [Psychrosphaera algicola]|uniref:hypothetical protein n=1 Tax=Psychrosphaera algicola TaxID=3023714 RepID=UPI002FEDF9D7
MGVKFCGAVAGTYALKILLNRGELVCAPYGLHYDGYKNKLKKAWRPGGNRNPLQKIMFSIAKKLVLDK